MQIRLATENSLNSRRNIPTNPINCSRDLGLMTKALPSKLGEARKADDVVRMDALAVQLLFYFLH